MVYMPEIGIKIKQLRNQRNISQIALAKHLGVSKSVVSSYENSVHYPPYDVLVKIAGLFGVSTDYLLGVSGNRAIYTDGLSDTQVDALMRIADELRSLNRAGGLEK